jgi:hypothetical protein
MEFSTDTRSDDSSFIYGKLQKNYTIYQEVIHKKATDGLFVHIFNNGETTMNALSALNSGIAGIQNGLRDAQRAAADIASADAFTAQSPTGIAESMIQLRQAETQVQASAKVVKAVDETIGSLLDEFA